MSWNPGIEKKQGQGQAVELSVLESWNRRENKVRVKPSIFASWNHGKEDTKVRVRLSNSVSWNPGIGGKKGQGQAVELRVLESWNRRGKRVRVRLSNLVSWNPGIEGGKGSGSGCRTSCLGILE